MKAKQKAPSAAPLAPPKGRPLNKKMLTRRLARASQTKGGIAIPENHGDKEQRCDVIAVGPDVTQVLPGEQIMVGKYSGTDVDLEGELFLVVDETEVLLNLSR